MTIATNAMIAVFLCTQLRHRINGRDLMTDPTVLATLRRPTEPLIDTRDREDGCSSSASLVSARE
eukprot:CAMPEP_0204627162 /NCGR_PEP_ID=MMETSP0717-20131115/13133_1 /ASSEMBLY_ACC=CAM_ASM_000666 /TAXON_ID=230516 /ORGANISM="Chaetoceros curvisetus" /LENGTH=64 /DNA_ID=CAMNT_0051643305 /DNA_START=337 /DNA_END=531 /DNA_ORIENTATION=+